MRLIDADALHTHKFLTPQVKVIGGRHNGKTREQIIEAYQKGWNDCIDAIVDNAPTAEPRSGKWDEIREPFGWDDILSARCSSCGESYPYPEDTGFNDIVEMFKYCPNCGAKMEAGDRWKEEEDEE